MVFARSGKLSRKHRRGGRKRAQNGVSHMLEPANLMHLGGMKVRSLQMGVAVSVLVCEGQVQAVAAVRFGSALSRKLDRLAGIVMGTDHPVTMPPKEEFLRPVFIFERRYTAGDRDPLLAIALEAARTQPVTLLVEGGSILLKDDQFTPGWGMSAEEDYGVDLKPWQETHGEELQVLGPDRAPGGAIQLELDRELMDMMERDFPMEDPMDHRTKATAHILTLSPKMFPSIGHRPANGCVFVCFSTTCSTNAKEFAEKYCQEGDETHGNRLRMEGESKIPTIVFLFGDLGGFGYVARRNGHGAIFSGEHQIKLKAAEKLDRAFKSFPHHMVVCLATSQAAADPIVDRLIGWNHEHLQMERDILVVTTFLKSDGQEYENNTQNRVRVRHSRGENFDALFPFCDVIVHTSGEGSKNKALLAGKPQIPWRPREASQLDKGPNQKEIWGMGVGPSSSIWIADPKSRTASALDPNDPQAIAHHIVELTDQWAYDFYAAKALAQKEKTFKGGRENAVRFLRRLTLEDRTLLSGQNTDNGAWNQVNYLCVNDEEHAVGSEDPAIEKNGFCFVDTQFQRKCPVTFFFARNECYTSEGLSEVADSDESEEVLKSELFRDRNRRFEGGRYKNGQL